MKITLKQLDDKCRRFVNPYMRRTRFGMSLVRRADNDIAVEMVPRKLGSQLPIAVKFTGAAREVDAFLSGLMTGLAMERVGDEEEDGSDA